MEFLRWIVFIPAGVIACCLVTFLVNIGLEFTWLNDAVIYLTHNFDGMGGFWVSGSIYVFTLSALAASTFIAVSSMVAPSNKKQVAKILAVLLGITTIVFIALAFYYYVIEMSDGECLYRRLITFVAWFVGCGYGFYFDPDEPDYYS